MNGLLPVGSFVVVQMDHKMLCGSFSHLPFVPLNFFYNLHKITLSGFSLVIDLVMGDSNKSGLATILFEVVAMLLYVKLTSIMKHHNTWYPKCITIFFQMNRYTSNMLMNAMALALTNLMK